jgi:hypothetical protein
MEIILDLFIYSLSNYAFSSSDCIASNGRITDEWRKTASGGCSAGQGSSEPVAPRMNWKV